MKDLVPIEKFANYKVVAGEHLASGTLFVHCTHPDHIAPILDVSVKETQLDTLLRKVIDHEKRYHDMPRMQSSG